MLNIVNKSNFKVECRCDTFVEIDIYLKDRNRNNYYITQEIDDMKKYLSTVISCDGVCVYNNKDFWTRVFNTNIGLTIEDIDKHDFRDIFGNKVSSQRVLKEYQTNVLRISQIDEQQGQIAYNIEIGNEFIALFRLECIKTKFTKESNTSPMIIFKKLGEVITMLSAGAFREAKQFLQGYRDVLRDDFLTDTRIDKYILMLDSADAIEYSTDEDYFYTAPEKTEANEFLEE